MTSPSTVYLDTEVAAFRLGGPWHDLREHARTASRLLMVPESRLEVLVGSRRARVAALTNRPVADLLVFGVTQHGDSAA